MNTSKKSIATKSTHQSGRHRSPIGVIAVLERLTGVRPLSNEIRDTAYRYLRNEKLFPELTGQDNSYEGKLARPGAHDLVVNALTLNEIFAAESAVVVSLSRRPSGERCQGVYGSIVTNPQGQGVYLLAEFDFPGLPPDWEQRLTCLVPPADFSIAPDVTVDEAKDALAEVLLKLDWGPRVR